MAATKKEIAAHEATTTALRIRCALSWTRKICPDVPPPDGSSGLTKGFLYNAHSARCEPACSSSVHHNFGSSSHTTTQGARSLYSTRLLALQAMRFEVEMLCATKLMEIDKQIEHEQWTTP